MEHHPKNNNMISIIIATYNAGAHLLKCLESIRAQKYPHIQIVIIDGASTDNTISLVSSFEYHNLLCISEPDAGIYDALNKGIDNASGNWLYFLGSDDYLLEGFSDIAKKLTAANTIYYGNSESFYTGEKPDYEILKGEFNNYGLTKYCINHQSIIYPSTAFKKYRYELKYKVFADYALNIKLWGDPSFHKVYIPISIVNYNMNGFSSVNKDAEFAKDKPKIIRKYMGLYTYLRYWFRNFKKRIRSENTYE